MAVTTPADREGKAAGAPGRPMLGPIDVAAVAERAYAHVLARGGRHGNDWADWFRAEAELRREAGNGTQPAVTSVAAVPPGRRGRPTATRKAGRATRRAGGSTGAAQTR